jgi:hypothetical protein
MPAVGCEGVPVRTEATERAWDVVTSKGALVAHLTTFVHILTDLRTTVQMREKTAPAAEVRDREREDSFNSRQFE